MKRTMIVAMAALLSGVACSVPPERAPTSYGNRPTATASASATSTPTNPATAAASPGASEPGDGHDEDEHDGSVSRKYSTESPPPERFRPPDTGDSTSGSGRLSLEMLVKPGCAEVGSRIAVTLRTKANIQIALLTNIPHDDGKYQEVRGRSGRDGLYHWTIVVPTRSPTGTFDVFGAGADDRGEDGGRSGSWLVVVAERGGCSS